MIVSPNFPKGWAWHKSLDCSWTMIAPYGQKIRLEFIKFNLSNPTIQKQCSTDYLEIYDGISDYYENPTRLCGDVHPIAIISNESSLNLEFHAVWKNFKQPGFELRYEAIIIGTFYVNFLIENNDFYG